MKKRLLAAVCSIICVFCFVACGKSEEKEKKVELNILAAASMTDVLTELGKEYQKNHEDVKLNFSFGSSGDLQTQIEQGAPADVFFSAGLKQMDALKKQGLMDEKTVLECLENKIVLIENKDSKLNLSSFEDVASNQVKMVAIGNPDGVPVGQYTKTIYENLKLWDKVKEKANYGKDVRQVLDWVATGNVDCGIVYATDAAIEDKVRVVGEAPKGSCERAIYPVGVVQESKHKEKAKKFLEFLQSKTAKTAFESYQFTNLK